jgi:hypothetical protein
LYFIRGAFNATDVYSGELQHCHTASHSCLILMNNTFDALCKITSTRTTSRHCLERCAHLAQPLRLQIHGTETRKHFTLGVRDQNGAGTHKRDGAKLNDCSLKLDAS